MPWLKPTAGALVGATPFMTVAHGPCPFGSPVALVASCFLEANVMCGIFDPSASHHLLLQLDVIYSGSTEPEASLLHGINCFRWPVSMSVGHMSHTTAKAKVSDG